MLGCIDMGRVLDKSWYGYTCICNNIKTTGDGYDNYIIFYDK